jgi:hypothetical protein
LDFYDFPSALLFCQPLFPSAEKCPLIFFFKTGSHYVAQVGLELLILLPLPPKCFDYRCMPPSLDKCPLLLRTSEIRLDAHRSSH